MQWKPMDDIPEGFIRKSAEPNAIDDKKGWTVIENIYKDDYVRPERISKDPRSGLLASLHAGMRAVSINIDAQGSSTAGAFILPNHFVDVIHIFKFKEEHFIQIGQNEPFTQNVPGEVLVRRTNVRVLAIGQKDQVVNGERAITGFNNATLEVTPEQAESLVLAQRTGTLTLALCSMSHCDANTNDEKNQHLAGELNR